MEKSAFYRKIYKPLQSRMWPILTACMTATWRNTASH